MGYLDSLANAPANVTAWVCVHTMYDGEKRTFLNDYRDDYTAHPMGIPLASSCNRNDKPVPGEKYWLVKIEPIIPPHNGAIGVVTDMLQIVFPKRTFKEEQLLKQYGLVRVQSYYPKREFYQPDSFDLQSSTPDPRNLLQWHPEVLTDDNGVAEVSFAASDINTEFIGIVEAFWKLLFLHFIQADLMAHVYEVGRDVAQASAELNGVFDGLVCLVRRMSQGSDNEQLDALKQGE